MKNKLASQIPQKEVKKEVKEDEVRFQFLSPILPSFERLCHSLPFSSYFLVSLLGPVVHGHLAVGRRGTSPRIAGRT